MSNRKHQNPRKILFSYVNWRDQIPTGFCLKSIDEILQQKMAIQVNPSISHTQGWIDDNLTLKEFGFCLFHGDEIVSICCSLIFGNKMCDISIATAEAFRKRNFATLVVSAFIDSCAVKGVTPVWYCSPENLASNALARKLGFEEKETFGHFIVGSNQPTTDGKGCFFPLNYGNDLLNDSQRHRFCSILRRKHPN